jgi:hypothetical protein
LSGGAGSSTGLSLIPSTDRKAESRLRRHTIIEFSVAHSRFWLSGEGFVLVGRPSNNRLANDQHQHRRDLNTHGYILVPKRRRQGDPTRVQPSAPSSAKRKPASMNKPPLWFSVF